jgi:hypothetical protein
MTAEPPAQGSGRLKPVLGVKSAMTVDDRRRLGVGEVTVQEQGRVQASRSMPGQREVQPGLADREAPGTGTDQHLPISPSNRSEVPPA